MKKKLLQSFLKKEIISIILISIFAINIYFLLKKRKFLTFKINVDEKPRIKIKNSNEQLTVVYKNSDYFFLNIIKKNYQEISNYLNNKYEFFNGLKIIKKEIIFSLKKYLFPSYKKIIVLYSVDLFSFSYHKKWLTDKLKEKFIIIFDKNKPDYLIYNVFGKEHLNPKYNNSIKIAIFTENIFPDFNKADYIIGFYHINYFDRYFKRTGSLNTNLNNTYFNLIREDVLKKPQRTKFCAAVISNFRITDGFRIKFINELNKYKKIDMGGKSNKNIGRRVRDKIEFLKSYKFSIAMENIFLKK